MTYASLQIKSFSTLTSNYLQAKQRLDDQPALLLSTGTLSHSWDQSRSTLYTALCAGCFGYPDGHTYVAVPVALDITII